MNLSTKRRPLRERVEALKTRKDRRYYELGLRDDLAKLIAIGMARQPGLTQKALTKLAGWNWESYVSRLRNAATNFKIRSAVQVLIPLGIEPMLVDKKDWIRLNSAILTEQENEIRAAQPPRAEHATTTTIATAKSGINLQIRINDRIGYEAGLAAIGGTKTESHGAAGPSDAVDWARSFHASAGCDDRKATLSYFRVLSDHARTVP